MALTVKVTFETDAKRRFLMHKGAHVALDGSGKGSFDVEANEWDLILFGIEGAPGAKAKITLKVPAGSTLEIAGHPIEGTIAQGKIVWGDSRFFRVRQ